MIKQLLFIISLCLSVFAQMTPRKTIPIEKSVPISRPKFISPRPLRRRYRSLPKLYRPYPKVYLPAKKYLGFVKGHFTGPKRGAFIDYD